MDLTDMGQGVLRHLGRACGDVNLQAPSTGCFDELKVEPSWMSEYLLYRSQHVILQRPGHITAWKGAEIQAT